MPDASLPEAAMPPPPAVRLGVFARLAMIAAGFLPLLHLGAGATAVMSAPAAWRVPVGLIALYLIPPLAARLCGVREATVPAGSSGFLRWWVQSQWQTVFNRIPWLEETLRLVPGLYSLWLRLWGARVGSLVYWAPGTRIVDRPLLDVGHRVVFGAGVRVHGHLLMPGADGAPALIVARVRVGDESLVGAYSLLAPGVRVARGESTPVGRTLGPFTEWSDGRRRFTARREAS